MSYSSRGTPVSPWSYKSNHPTLEQFIQPFINSTDQIKRAMAHKVLQHHRGYNDFSIQSAPQMSSIDRYWRERVVILVYNRRNLQVNGMIDEYGMVRLSKGIELMWEVAVMYVKEPWNRL